MNESLFVDCPTCGCRVSVQQYPPCPTCGNRDEIKEARAQARAPERVVGSQPPRCAVDDAAGSGSQPEESTR
jgi:endogenous inhibitor of DNA gyrase (YacG/DUF329 family)